MARRVFLEYPSSDAAPAAQYLVGQGLALLGEPRQAMEEFQRVRNRFPESDWAARALDRITALYRLYGYGKPTFALDTALQRRGRRPVEGRACDPHDPPGDRSGSPRRRRRARCPSTRGQARAEPARPKSPGPSPSIREGQIVVTARIAVRVGTKDIKSFAIPGGQAGARASREDHRGRRHPRGQHPRGRREAEQGLPLQRALGVPVDLPRRRRTRRSARSPVCSWTGKAGIVMLDREREDGAGLRRDRQAAAHGGAHGPAQARWTWPSTRSATPTWPTKSWAC